MENIKPSQKPNLIEMAKKRRHLHLVEKLAKGKSFVPTLSKGEIHELEKFEIPAGSPAIVDTQEQVAKMFRVSTRTVQYWQKDGMPLTKDKRYDLIDIHKWRMLRAKKREKRPTHKDELDKWKIEKIKIEVLRLRGELIAIKEVENELIQISVTMRRHLLELKHSLPTLLKGREPKEMESIIGNKVEYILSFFSIGKIIDASTRRSKRLAKQNQDTEDLD